MFTGNNEITNNSKWCIFYNEVKYKLKSPLKHPEFIFHFVFFVCGLGSIGIWIQYIKSVEGIPTLNLNLSTYFLVLLSTSVINLLLTKESDVPTIFKYWAISTLIIGVIIAFLFLNCLALLMFGTIISLFNWWIGNSNNPELTSPINLKSAIGNDVTKDLTGDIGDFKI